MTAAQRINHLPLDDERRATERRRMAVKTLLLGGTALGVAMVLVLAIVSRVEHAFFNPFSVHRIKAAAEALPAALAAPADGSRTVYVLGSSLVEFGFSPEIFDAALAEAGVPVRSYNFGYGNADPSIHHRFATRLARTFADHPGKLDLVIFEFTPFQAVRKREEQTGQLDHATRAILSDARDIAAVAKTDHQEAVALFNTKYIRDGVPAEAVTNLLGQLTSALGRPAAPVQEPGARPMQEQGMELYRRLMQEWQPEGAPGGWYASHRGGLPPTASAEALQMTDAFMVRLQRPERMQASRRQRIACCDIEELEFSERMVSEFIAGVKEAQKVARHVDILLMPRNQDLISLSPRGRANLQAAVARISRETGARVVDFSESPRYGLEEFLDADHLTLFRGRERLSRQLAGHYRSDPLLQAAATATLATLPTSAGTGTASMP